MKLDMASHNAMGRPPVEIRLNGLVVHNCIVCDEENGFVGYYDKPPKLEKIDGCLCLVTHTGFGDVEIILGDDVRKR